MEFEPFPKIPRLARDIVITEMIDGTNASIRIFPADYTCQLSKIIAISDDNKWAMFAGSRTRWITPDEDNYGFAAWARDNAASLFELGEGMHFGEWWGAGIQRRYGMERKVFSLFNVGRWNEQNRPECCDVVPVLYRGEFSEAEIQTALNKLRYWGSFAAPGFKDPEGIIVYHEAAKQMFKKTLTKDEQPKGKVVEKQAA